MFKLSSRFRWIFCQLEVLRHCLPPSVRRTLDELPESLDETYERVLKEIKKPNRDHALRVLRCLVVAIRPLQVEELAEVLAVNFDDEEGIPKLNPHWRWDDQEQALLSSCSSLIAIVESGEARVVQFSHFSVKEYLTSPRLATSSGDVSRYHIDPEPAHTILAQSCMSVLLQLDNRVEESDVGHTSPLVGYAAEHWVAHAQDQKVRSCLRKAMVYLFDVDKPYFTSWLKLRNMDVGTSSVSTFFMFTTLPTSGVTPLYYAAQCGFQDLVEHLVANNPEQVNAPGGWFVTPLVVALSTGQFQMANFLYDNGADVNVTGHNGHTLLHAAALYGDFELAQVLFKYRADINARDVDGMTPLHTASRGVGGVPSIDPLSLSNVARLLLEHGADINARDNQGSTPLHLATQYGRVEVVRVLLEYGAGVGAEDDKGRTALQVTGSGLHHLHVVSNGRGDEIMKLLSEHGAR